MYQTDNIFGAYVLDAKTASDFNYEAAKIKLVNIDLDVEQESNMIFTTPDENLTNDAENQNGIGRQGRLIRLAGWIDLDSKLTVG